jgi:hypothetical protein
MRALPLFLFTCCTVRLAVAQPVSFLPPVTINNGLGGPIHFDANSLVAADINGDKIPDLVALSALNDNGYGALDVSLGNGDGTFQPTRTLIPATVILSPPVVADFNGDGRPDIAILQTLSLRTTPASSPTRTSLLIFLGNGDGTFRSINWMPLANGGHLIVADWNHDGLPDLVSGPLVLLSNGDGTFTPSQRSWMARRS